MAGTVFSLCTCTCFTMSTLVRISSLMVQDLVSTDDRGLFVSNTVSRCSGSGLLCGNCGSSGASSDAGSSMLVIGALAIVPFTFFELFTSGLSVAALGLELSLSAFSMTTVSTVSTFLVSVSTSVFLFKPCGLPDLSMLFC